MAEHGRDGEIGQVREQVRAKHPSPRHGEKERDG